MYKDSFFRRNKLDAHLRGRLSDLESYISRLSLEEVNRDDEDNLINEIVKKYTVDIPKLVKEGLKIDAKEAQVEVTNNASGFHFQNGSGFVKGLSITITVAFTGDEHMFFCMPSTYSLSGTPEGVIVGNTIILTYETIQKDPEIIKKLWQSEIDAIEQNLEWIERDVNQYSSSLENQVRSLLTHRKKEAQESKDLIDKLKLG